MLSFPSAVPQADVWLSTLHAIQEDLVSSLTFAKKQQALYHNRSRRPADTYSPGDLVWLSRRNLKTSRPCNKLDVRRVGPFRVDHMVGKNAVKLFLTPALKRLHPVFNLSLTSRYVPPLILAEIWTYPSSPLSQTISSVKAKLLVSSSFDEHRLARMNTFYDMAKLQALTTLGYLCPTFLPMYSLLS